MKRVFLLFALALSTASMAFAQETVSVASGDIKSLLKEKKAALFEADFSKTVVGDVPLNTYLSDLGEDHLKDWPEAVNDAAGYFIKEFNKRSEGLTIRESETVVKADYLIRFRVLYYSPGDNVAKNIPLIAKDGGTTLSGYIDFINQKTGETVCSLVVDEVTGASYPSVAPRLGFAYVATVKRIFGLIDGKKK